MELTDTYDAHMETVGMLDVIVFFLAAAQITCFVMKGFVMGLCLYSL